ncbi:PREDICTED: uncharacterized protein LOC105362146 [Ceratosolen solmsi marchali]|uniref:Uncharacterized protein LOC105362146 n=1 Tax=Ceratosolen solmsi marchali TaxID=326594 RepID=A0AAJ6YGV6_9HYME|nr:PREDICTED: uncharacterized protein LOC105362146 [Ceratosolen solmsi marchali]
MSALPFALGLNRLCWLILSGCLIVGPLRAVGPSDRPSRALSGDDERPASQRTGLELDAYDELADEDLADDYAELNVTAEKSKYLGSPCDLTCNPTLQHVFCDPETKFCGCEKPYPVQLGPTKGCAKPKKLGEQCLYRATCVYTDQHSTCTQVQHNAVCECEAGYHRVALSRPNKKLFCAADLVLIATDLPTLLGVASGIAVLTGLICFVLKLFSRARYTRPRHYANAGQAPPPMLFSSDTGIPLALHGGRPSSRSSQRSSGGTLSCALARKQSDALGASTRGPLVPASRAGAARAAAILLISCHREAQPTPGNGGKHRRALSDVAEGSSDGLGSRRPSLASIHSSTSSAKSYSARRLERERNEKEQRHALVELKLKHREQQQQQHHHQQQHQQQQQQQQQQYQQQEQQQSVAPIPSPRTPHSTDELLPSVEEATEIFYNEQIPTTSGAMSNAADDNKTRSTTTTNNEPSSPLFENDAKPCTSSDMYRL